MMNHQDLPAFVKILSKTAKILIPLHQPDFEASHDVHLRKNNLFLRKQVSQPKTVLTNGIKNQKILHTTSITNYNLQISIGSYWYHRQNPNVVCNGAKTIGYNERYKICSNLYIRIGRTLSDYCSSCNDWCNILPPTTIFKGKMDGALHNLFLPEEFVAWHH